MTSGKTGACGAVAAAVFRVKVIHFGRNFGQTAAMAAGFDFSEGRVIVPMDGDLQNDPADIPLLLAKLRHNLKTRFSPAQVARIEAACADQAKLEALPVDDFVALWVSES